MHIRLPFLILGTALLASSGVAAQNTDEIADRAGVAREPAPIRVELSRELATPGGIAVITFWFAGNGETAGFGGDFVISHPDAIADIDLSGCLGDSTAQVGTCAHPGDDPSRIRILLANDRITPLERFSGTIVLRLNRVTPPGELALTWDPRSWDVAVPKARVEATDGWIAVVPPR